MKYDPKKVYVGVNDGTPYLLVGGYSPYEGRYAYRFHSFDGMEPSCMGWMPPISSDEDLLERHIQEGFSIYPFNTTLEAFKFCVTVLEQRLPKS